MFGKLFGLNKKSSKRSSSGHHHHHKSANFGFLGTDMHSHVLPGLDDGAPDMETAITMIRSLQRMSFSSLIATPHIRHGHYANTKETIEQKLAEVRKRLAEEGIDLPIKAAAEYFVDEHFVALLDSGEPLLTIRDKEVLIEFSFVFEPTGISKILAKMIGLGYVPILAHAERYTYYHANSDSYIALKEAGCLLQLNVTSLNGYYGSKVKHVAETLLEKGLYDYCGTDAHHDKHLESLDKLRHSEAISDLQKHSFLNSKL